MKINIAKLRKEPGTREDFVFTFGEGSVPENWFVAEDDLEIKQVQVKGHLSNTGNLLNLSMRIKTEVVLPCSRCLDEVVLPLDLEVNDDYCHEEDWRSLFPNEEESTSTVFLLKDDWIDLKQVVQENLMLSLPMRALCTPDCPGICPHCGQSLKEGPCNCHGEVIDPRLEVLAQLKNKMKC